MGSEHLKNLRTSIPMYCAGLAVTLPFFLRKARTSLFPRSGAAPFVPYDPAALHLNPGITWIGHSTMLVRLGRVSFLTDPIFSERASPLPFVGPRRLVPPGVPLQALPPLDFVTLSHDHYDHADLPTIRALAARDVRFFVPAGLGDLVRECGGTAVELRWWEQAALDSVTIHCVPAQHFAGRTLLDHGERLWSGWVIETSTRRFYHAGDTGYFAGFAEIGKRFGPIDLAALPIGAYLPAAMMRQVHLNPEQSLRAAQDVRARRIVGMHFGTFDLTDEALDEPPRRFRAEAERIGWDAQERAWLLQVGETRSW